MAEKYEATPKKGKTKQEEFITPTQQAAYSGGDRKLDFSGPNYLYAYTQTRGGVEYADLCSGAATKNYAFNLVSLAGFTNMTKAVKSLYEHIRRMAFLDLTRPNNSRNIDKFMVGKTSAEKKKKCDEIDPMDENTILKNYIGSRWRTSYKDKMDGMVVVNYNNHQRYR